MRRHASILIAAALLLTAAPASGSLLEEMGYGLNHFELWNECRPMKMFVMDVKEDMLTRAAPTEEAIEIAVRSRLRGARLYSEPSAEADAAHLIVSVNVTPERFSIDFSYKKRVTDHATERRSHAETWFEIRRGRHGEDSNFILSAIEQLTDSFIDEYLRVNAEACE